MEDSPFPVLPSTIHHLPATCDDRLPPPPPPATSTDPGSVNTITVWSGDTILVSIPPPFTDFDYHHLGSVPLPPRSGIHTGTLHDFHATTCLPLDTMMGYLQSTVGAFLPPPHSGLGCHFWAARTPTGTTTCRAWDRALPCHFTPRLFTVTYCLCLPPGWEEYHFIYHSGICILPTVTTDWRSHTMLPILPPLRLPVHILPPFHFLYHLFLR